MTTDERAKLLLAISFLCIPAMFLLTLAIGGVGIGFTLAGDDLDDLRSGASITMFVLLALLLVCALTCAVCVVRGGDLERDAMRERHERERREREL
jgi:uncharacterized membrane protein AbrB (regulator of aidB expression)